MGQCFLGPIKENNYITKKKRQLCNNDNCAKN